MTVSGTPIVVQPDGRVYREVEEGVSLFSAFSAETGDLTGGTVSHEFQFHDGGPGATLYVVITRIAVTTKVAANTGAGWRAYTTGSQFERFSGPTSPDILIAGGPMQEADSPTIFIGSWYGSVNLSRGTRNDEASVLVDVENVDTMTTAVLLEGLLSAHPIAARWWIGA